MSVEQHDCGYERFVVDVKSCGPNTPQQRPSCCKRSHKSLKSTDVPYSVAKRYLIRNETVETHYGNEKCYWPPETCAVAVWTAEQQRTATGGILTEALAAALALFARIWTSKIYLTQHHQLAVPAEVTSMRSVVSLKDVRHLSIRLTEEILCVHWKRKRKVFPDEYIESLESSNVLYRYFACFILVESGYPCGVGNDIEAQTKHTQIALKRQFIFIWLFIAITYIYIIFVMEKGKWNIYPTVPAALSTHI